ncbi:hypothetical protein [Thermomonospora umbrina]|uniref:Uncharacterized protein n=1 Tax=Thermomonospora umbrina TaxID=111806 RepID=A0A3D9SNX0_9ACTN|nr:hypothetical protein [Thermomonospora umbrina]REE96140.1 hypothetical protein DFJ69_1565 [Thermomonospora umbrina]
MDVAGTEPRGAEVDVTRVRMRLLGELAVALSELGRDSSLLMRGGGEPVLAVWPSRHGASDKREVVAVQDGGGWSFLWGGGARCRVTDEGSPRVAAFMVAQGPKAGRE